MTWLVAILVGLLVVSNLGWLCVTYVAERRIVRMERLCREASDVLERTSTELAQHRLVLQQLTVKWPVRQAH